MPVYNREGLVRSALESVLDQTYRPDQIIAVDDGSTDGTRSVLDSFAPMVTVLTQNNQGPYPARNLALKQARGSYIAFLDSDDVWLPNKLEKQVSVLEAAPEVGLVFGDGELIYEQTARSDLPGRFFELEAPARGWIFELLIRNNFIPQSSVLARRECFEVTGPFLEIPLAADYHKWLQISLSYQIEYIDEILFKYAVHAGNISADRVKKFTALNAVFKNLLATTTDGNKAKILQRRLLQSDYELALAELDRAGRRILRGVMRKENGLGSTARLKCLAQVTWRKSRWLVGLK
jgi:glycosyltransferase involved in cell wall biosynthesis